MLVQCYPQRWGPCYSGELPVRSHVVHAGFGRVQVACATSSRHAACSHVQHASCTVTRHKQA